MAGARAFVYPNIVLVYSDRGVRWVDASRMPVDGAAPRSVVLGSTLAAEAEVGRFSGGHRFRLSGFLARGCGSWCTCTG